MDLKDRTFRDHLTAISQILTHGLIFENKRVGKANGAGLIFVPKTLIGESFKVILIPVDKTDFKLRTENLKLRDQLDNIQGTINRLEGKKKVLIKKVETKEEEISLHDTEDSSKSLESAEVM